VVRVARTVSVLQNPQCFDGRLGWRIAEIGLRRTQDRPVEFGYLRGCDPVNPNVEPYPCAIIVTHTSLLHLATNDRHNYTHVISNVNGGVYY
jgi:hypothetical protein